MARLAVETHTEKKLIETEVEVKEYTLTLSEEEADILHSILGIFLAGGPTSPIFNVLTDAVGGYGNYDVMDKTSKESHRAVLLVAQKRGS